MKIKKVFGLRQRIGLIFFGLLMIAVALTSTYISVFDEIRLLAFGMLGAVLVVGSFVFKADVYVFEHDVPPHNSGGSLKDK